MTAWPDRDRRAVLWLTCAAVCWRWLVGAQAPMPSAEACRDLYLAERLAVGDFAELAHRWWEPLWGMLLAPFLACGAPSFATAQVAACVLGGAAVAAVALAAERMRTGAGVPAAVVATVSTGSVLNASVGGATALLSLLGGLSLWAFAAGRVWLSVLLVALVVMAGADEGPVPLNVVALLLDEVAEPSALLRIAGSGGLLLPLLLWPQRRLVELGFGGALLVPVIAGMLWVELPWSSPFWWPLLATMAGVALARLPVRLRDVLLTVVAAIDLHAGWTLVEARQAVVERLAPSYLVRRELPEGQIVASPLARVAWAAGQRPRLAPSLPAMIWSARSGSSIATSVSQPAVGAIIVTRWDFDYVVETSQGQFARAWLPPDLQDLADAHGLAVLRRGP